MAQNEFFDKLTEFSETLVFCLFYSNKLEETPFLFRMEIFVGTYMRCRLSPWDASIEAPNTPKTGRFWCLRVIFVLFILVSKRKKMTIFGPANIRTISRLKNAPKANERQI